MFYPVLLASLLGARLLVTHRAVSAPFAWPLSRLFCYVLTHHPRAPSSLTSLFRFSRLPRHHPRSAPLAVSHPSRVTPFPPSRRPPSPLFLSLSLSSPPCSARAVARRHCPSSRAVIAQSGVRFPFLPFSSARVGGAWCRGTADVSSEESAERWRRKRYGGVGRSEEKVKEEEMEEEKKEEATPEE